MDWQTVIGYVACIIDIIICVAYYFRWMKPYES